MHIDSCYFDFKDLKKELLVEQLVFDILFDKYLSETKEMTLLSYSIHISNLLYTDKSERMMSKDAIYRNLKRCMKSNYLTMKHSPQLRKELTLLSVNPEQYDQYFTHIAKDNVRKTKPKYVWDCIYYNRNMITYRQYRRELKKDGNYSYERFIQDFHDYNNFVNKLLPVDNESVQNYFHKSMDYYILESYKRIDFMCKLIKTMPSGVVSEIDKDHFLVKRFHPCVLIPYEQDNHLRLSKKCKYYRPLLRIEEELHQQILNDTKGNYSIYADQLLKHHIVRAKAYELFKYYMKYVSSDYSEIKKFISLHYNMCSYHNSTEIWAALGGKQWNQMDDETKRQVKGFLQNFILINKALFWESPKRKIEIPM